MEHTALEGFVNDHWPTQGFRGVASSRMLAAAGMSDKAIASATRRKILIRLFQGAYIQETTWSSLKPWQRDEVLLAGHVVGSHSRGVYSHTSAARLQGLRTWGCGPKVHITHSYAPGNSGHGSNVVMHQQSYAVEQIVMMDVGLRHVPVTSLAQTVVDCARFLAFEHAVVIGDHAIRQGIDVAGLQLLLDSSAIKRGSAKARKVLEFLDPLSESAGESRTRAFLARTQLPMPELQLTITTRHGRHRVDFAWQEYRLILEFDGWGKYFDYRPTAEAIAQERQREKDLMELGWQFVRINWRDLNDPGALELRIRSALLRAGAQLPPVRTSIIV